MNCLLCNNENTENIFDYTGNDIYLQKLGIKDFELKWYECKNCGVYFSSQYPDIERVYEDPQLYDGQYDRTALLERYNRINQMPIEKSDNYLRSLRVRNFFQEYCKNFKVSKNNYSLLDIGAGMGVFLFRMRENFDCYAIEANPVACEHIKSVLGIPVYQSFIQNLETEMKFDVITLNKVLEHISKPQDILKTLKNIIHENTLIYIELPDVLGYKNYGDTCDAFASGHYMVYEPNSFAYLLKECGLEILKLERIFEPSGKISIYSFARLKY